jgi:hypothetical protein
MQIDRAGTEKFIRGPHLEYLERIRPWNVTSVHALRLLIPQTS